MKLQYSLKHNLDYLIIGITGVLIGLILIHDRNYFFWPPQFVLFFNNYAIGILGLMTGLGVTVYGLIGIHNDKIAGTLLAGLAFFVAVILFGEILPVIGIGYQNWHIGTILLAFYLAEIMKVAYLRKPTNKKN
ncbi:hypothetical protein [Lactobacillus kitasatonis]|uniref:hypothetical protein n=1 Tax=Lactobacillus kitasatonis TaxID=237446 RepID=UPI0026F28D4A|nr:hypothetical protein [Lactobacillus kitasatonis]